MIPIRPPIRSWARAAALLLIAGSLSACITLLPKSKPAQLYRFDGRATLSAVKAPDGGTSARVGISRAGGSFQGAASGDRILSVTGPVAPPSVKPTPPPAVKTRSPVSDGSVAKTTYCAYERSGLWQRRP